MANPSNWVPDQYGGGFLEALLCPYDVIMVPGGSQQTGAYISKEEQQQAALSHSQPDLQHYNQGNSAQAAATKTSLDVPKKLDYGASCRRNSWAYQPACHNQAIYGGPQLYTGPAVEVWPDLQGKPQGVTVRTEVAEPAEDLKRLGGQHVPSGSGGAEWKTWHDMHPPTNHSQSELVQTQLRSPHSYQLHGNPGPSARAAYVKTKTSQPDLLNYGSLHHINKSNHQHTFHNLSVPKDPGRYTSATASISPCFQAAYPGFLHRSGSDGASSHGTNYREALINNGNATLPSYPSAYGIKRSSEEVPDGTFSGKEMGASPAQPPTSGGSECAPPRKMRKPKVMTPECMKDERYYNKRQKNNVAVARSRDAQKRLAQAKQEEASAVRQELERLTSENKALLRELALVKQHCRRASASASEGAAPAEKL